MNASKRILSYSFLVLFLCGGAQRTAARSLFAEVVRQGVPFRVARAAFKKFDQFSLLVTNRKYMSIVDFTKFSGEERFFMINTETGHVDKLLVAHGVGSDPDNTGIPRAFSNAMNSKMSSLGAYIVNEQYQSPAHGTAARLDGLEPTDNLAREREIVLHSAEYVTPTRQKMGRSWGCPAIPMAWLDRAMQRLTGGSFLYIYGHAKARPHVAEAEGSLLDVSNGMIDQISEDDVDGDGT